MLTCDRYVVDSVRSLLDDVLHLDDLPADLEVGGDLARLLVVGQALDGALCLVNLHATLVPVKYT